MSKHTLKFVDQNAKNVSEAFGIKDKLFSKVGEVMHDFFESYMETDNIEAPAKSVLLEDFLKSDEFAKSGYPLETSNDYFVLGYMFCGLVIHLKEKYNTTIPEELKQLLLSKLSELHPDIAQQIKNKKKRVN